MRVTVETGGATLATSKAPRCDKGVAITEGSRRS